MKDKVRGTIEQYGMLLPNDRVTVAVSGGADSVALLDVLCALTDFKLRVSACHVNHCLRGAESDRDETLVRTMCREYGIPLDVRRVDVGELAKAQGISVELAARRVRYQFFEELADRDGGKVATAHSLSDTAETVVFNLCRGTGLAGLCGIPRIRGRIIRPLLACSRKEIESYCYAHGLYFVTDFSNFSDEYTRNFIRSQITPKLVQVNSGALEAMGRMTEMLREDSGLLMDLAREAKARCSREDGMDVALLAKEPASLRTRVIALMLEAHDVQRSAQRIAAVDKMLFDKRRHTISLKDRRVYAVVRKGVLRLEQRLPAPAAEPFLGSFSKDGLDKQRVLLGKEKTLAFSLINCAEYEIFTNIPSDPLKNAVDYDKICNDILLRARRPGDCMRPVGRGCTKTLKKLHNEMRLADRDTLCVLADSGGVFFAESVGVDERVRVDKGTRRILTIQITKETEA